jgi:hypothetical protein
MLGYSFLWWCGAIISVTGAAYALPRLWRAMLAVFDFISRLDSFARLLPQFIHMLKQFYPNGGTSVVDRIGKLEKGHDEILLLNRSQCDSFANQGIVLAAQNRSIEEVNHDVTAMRTELERKNL